MPDVPRGLSERCLDISHLEGPPRVFVDDSCSLAVDVDVPDFPPLDSHALANHVKQGRFHLHWFEAQHRHLGHQDVHPSTRIPRDLNLKHSPGADGEQVRIEFLLADSDGVALGYSSQQCITHPLYFYDVSAPAGHLREGHHLVFAVLWCWCLRHPSICSHFSTARRHQHGSGILTCELTRQSCRLDFPIRHWLQQQGIWRACSGLQCPDRRRSQSLARRQCCSCHKGNSLSFVSFELGAHLVCTGDELLHECAVVAPLSRFSTQERIQGQRLEALLDTSHFLCLSELQGLLALGGFLRLPVLRVLRGLLFRHLHPRHLFLSLFPQLLLRLLCPRAPAGIL